MQGEQRDARCRYFKAHRRDSNYYMQEVKDSRGMGWGVYNSTFEETLASLERSVNRDVKRGIDTLYEVIGTNARQGNYGYGQCDGPFVMQKWEFMTSEFDQFKNLFVNSVQYQDAVDEFSTWTDEDIEDSMYYASAKKSESKPKFSDMVNKQRNKALKKGNVDSEGVEFADTNMERYANDLIGFANNIINLEAEIKAEYERTSEMPRELMEQLFNNIYSLDHYKSLLDGEYRVWLARYGIK